MIFKRYLHRSLSYSPLVELAFSHFKPQEKNAQKPAILMLHGLFGCRKNFHFVGKALSSDLNTDVYSVDLRNHGQSPLAKPYDYITLTKDVIHFIERQMGPETPVYIVGFSLGGRVGLLSSLSKKVNIKKCISVDMPPYPLSSLDAVLVQNYNKMMEIETRTVKIRKGTRKWRDEVLKEFRNVPANKSNQVALYFASGFLQVKNNDREDKLSRDADEYINYSMPLLEMPDLFQKVMEWPDITKLNRDEFSSVSRSRVLFMRALKSPFISSDYSLLSKHYPNCTVEEFDTGHVLIGEAPKKFYQQTLAFCLDE
ncbi:LAFE_0D02102g1_1 [Lachancea fermentati]|uniref:LAFE_0D02102g1_1 n=1 Tax=Lachancea fermentati TaxID=4955 RepID=A0A1G4MAU2_LACFM|nr:LAFE_0D02102g1_1 [Lachancea fermentati]